MVQKSNPHASSPQRGHVSIIPSPTSEAHEFHVLQVLYK